MRVLRRIWCKLRGHDEGVLYHFQRGFGAGMSGLEWQELEERCPRCGLVLWSDYKLVKIRPSRGYLGLSEELYKLPEPPTMWWWDEEGPWTT